jgi:hypothetical protein
MNKRALTIGLFYALAAIVFKLIILLGGYTLSKFGFYYSNILSVFLILPFFFLAIYQVREKDFYGIISGKDAMRMALIVLAVGIVLSSFYNFIEFNWKYKEIAIQYYKSQEYLDILKNAQLKNPEKIKISDFPKIIEEQLSSLSATKATTGKLFPLLFIGLSGAFIAAVLMKKSGK